MKGDIFLITELYFLFAYDVKKNVIEGVKNGVKDGLASGRARFAYWWVRQWARRPLAKKLPMGVPIVMQNGKPVGMPIGKPMGISDFTSTCEVYMYLLKFFYRVSLSRFYTISKIAADLVPYWFCILRTPVFMVERVGI